MTVSCYSTIIQHDADKVWDTLRDFNGLATWFGSAVSESHITQDGSPTMVALADVAAAEVGGEADPAEIPGRAGVRFEEVRLAGRPGVALLVQAIS